MAKGPRKRKRKTHHKIRPEQTRRFVARPEPEWTDRMKRLLSGGDGEEALTLESWQELADVFNAELTGGTLRFHGEEGRVAWTGSAEEYEQFVAPFRQQAGRGDEQSKVVLIALGELRDVTMFVGGQTDEGESDPTLTGLMVDRRTEQIIGAAPGTPASKLTAAEAAARTGYALEEGAAGPRGELRTMDPHRDQPDLELTVQGERWLSEQWDKREAAGYVTASRDTRRMVETTAPVLAPMAAAPYQSGEPVTREQVGMVLRERLYRIAPGWSLAPAKHNPEDVTILGRGSDEFAEHIAISGMLADAIAGGAEVLGVAPEEFVKAALSEWSGAPLVSDVSVGHGWQGERFGLEGESQEERLLELAVLKRAAQVWPGDGSLERRVRLPLPDGEPIKLTYVGLANIVADGRGHPEFPCAMTEEDLRRCDPHKQHELVLAWRIPYVRQVESMPEEAVTIVRIGIMAMGRNGNHVAFLHDMTTQTWEALTGTGPAIPTYAASIDPDAFRLGHPEEYRLGERDRPRWAGGRAFDKVWDRCSEFAELGNWAVDRGIDLMDMPEVRDYSDSHAMNMRGIVGYAQTALSGMLAATEVLVDPDQVNAMPDFESWQEAEAYAGALHLPFEQVFIDLEGPARACALASQDGGEDQIVLAVRGAHVIKLGDALHIIPFGAMSRPADVDGVQTYNPLGLFVFGGRTAEPAVWRTQAVLDTGFMHTGMVVDPAAISGPWGIRRTPYGPVADNPDPRKGTGWQVSLVTGLDDEQRTRSFAFTTCDGDVEQDHAEVAIAAGALTAAAQIVLRALFLFDMSNVEIVEAPITRQWRRQAQRAGQPIAMSVRILSNSKRYPARADDGEHVSMEYSHRFRVRGHVKHFGLHTRTAQARPDLCTPCGRCGRCRKVWTPPFVKGPDDKPLILKSLVRD